MIQTLFAYLLIVLVIVAAYPWASWLLRQRRVTHPLVTALTLALGVGMLTLVMLWEGMLGIPFSTAGITLPYLAAMLPGLWLWQRDRASWTPSTDAADSDAAAPASPALRRTATRWLPTLILAAITLAILFNGVYWPFHRDDTLGIYMPHAQMMYEARGLVPLTGADSLYRAYPMLVSSAYTYTYLASGWENEYLAKLVATLLSVGCLPVAFVLGKMLGGEGTSHGSRAGWISAFLLALAPNFGRWASAGYVDLPMAFFYGLSAVFALRLWHSASGRDAFLAGAMMGLAVWTKNAALIGVPLLGVWLLWALLHRKIQLQQALVAGIACALVAAPWYARNLAGAGFLIPNTAWTDQAQRTLNNLLAFVVRFDNFAFTGWAAMAGVGYAVAQVLRRRENAPGSLLLLLWTVPFFAAWWLFVSYDPRFLLLFLPPLCALGGAWLSAVWQRLPRAWQRPALALAGVIVLVFTVQTLWFSVEYKDELLRSPFMSDADKHAIVGRTLP